MKKSRPEDREFPRVHTRRYGDSDLQARLLERHLAQLRACERCPQMRKPVVTCGAVLSEVLLVGQAPGDKEPVLGKPFAWTAGQTLFRWFEEAAGITENEFRAAVYMAAVCRCFPGKKPSGGDRVPSQDEVRNCSSWLKSELEILKPKLVIPVGKLAIEQFLPHRKLDEMIGHKFRVRYFGHTFDIVPLPHPSGASPWHRIEPGKSLLRQALVLIADHRAFRGIMRGVATRKSKS